MRLWLSIRIKSTPYAICARDASSPRELGTGKLFSSLGWIAVPVEIGLYDNEQYLRAIRLPNLRRDVLFAGRAGTTRGRLSQKTGRLNCRVQAGIQINIH